MKRILCFLLGVLAAPVLCAKIAVPNADYADAWQRFSLADSGTQPRQQFPYQACFEQAAKKHRVPLPLLLAMARGESDFNAQARSSANAYGVMQILWPSTAKYLGIDSLQTLKQPCPNIDAGARYIKEQIDRFDGDIHLALAAYNYGPARIAKNPENIPDGANWYSGYIYSHLQYVLGERKPGRRYNAPARYRDENKLRIATFSKAYRSIAFVQAMQARAPSLRLDTFDNGLGRFHVVLLYGNKRELKAGKKALANAGLIL